ncbi:uncharacterized protein GIQ15_02168 [Arthroderma uncinatum]|uniref:uncharacterized protein n=1 Tax=Arthroderma uncinatum TaxID=74035 RepID=UPI00144A59E3|nr:uncharacterized protein GIQ15_02168 [Arthroderma uncinatum]KAF3482844.1 hypothetical protein GIQ15_02168 [Arthroderma uncinatum]
MSGATGNSAAGGYRWDAERFTKERDARQEPAPYREMRPRRGPPSVEDEREHRTDRRSLFSSVQDYLQPAETQNHHLVPARRADREYNDKHLESGTPSRRRPDASPARGASDDRDFRRPTLLRRQSSLDRFDLATTKRSHDYRRYDRDDYGPPITPRKRSPNRLSDLKFEKLRISETHLGDDIARRSMSGRNRSATPRGRRSSSVRPDAPREKSRRPSPRPGTTRIPKHMVAPRALDDLGYEFEEYEEDIMISKVLTDERIHELVEYSKVMRQGVPTTAKRTKEKETVIIGAKDSPLAVERRRSVSRRRARTPSPPMEVLRPVRAYSPSPRPRPRPRHVRRRSSPIRVLEVEDDHPERLLVPYRNRPSERELREQMRVMAAIEGPPAEVVVRRDHKAPTPRLLRAMMATLT